MLDSSPPLPNAALPADSAVASDFSPAFSPASGTPSILALAASGALCSVVLRTAQAQLHWQSTDSNQQSEQMLPAIERLLKQAGVVSPDVIAVDIGPGAFTSVRVVCGIAQGLALGWNCPVIAVNSLHALAEQAIALDSSLQTITCVLDARMQECYVAHFIADQTGLQEAIPPHLMSYAQVHTLSQTLNQTLNQVVQFNAMIGNAAPVLPQWEPLSTQSFHAQPSAQGVLLAALRQFSSNKAVLLAPEAVQPLYVRDQVAYTAAQRAEQQCAVLPKAQIK